MKNSLLTLLVVILFTDCNSKKTNKKELLQSEDFNIIINAPDTLDKNQELFASIHISNKKYKLLFAHFACNISDSTKIDKTRGRIIGCNQNLVTENDSVKIWLNVGELIGNHNFEEVTLLATDIDNNYYYQKCSFNYYVR